MKVLGLLSIAALTGLASALVETNRLNIHNDVPRQRFWTIEGAQPAPITAEAVGEPVDLGLNYVRSVRADKEFEVTDSYKTAHNGLTHVYLRQTIRDIPVMNGVANMNVAPSGSVLSYEDSFYDGEVPQTLPTPIPASQAVHSLAKFLSREVRQQSSVKAIYNALYSNYMGQGIKVVSENAESAKRTTVLSTPGFGLRNEVEANLEWVQVDGGKRLVLGWEMVVELEENWYDAVVDATTGEIVTLYDWVEDATYNAFPIGVNDPSDGERVLMTNPATNAIGWHDQVGKTYTSTIGNNAYAQENWSGASSFENNYRPSSDGLNFDYPLDMTKPPKEMADAAITNLFVWNNFIHDVFYNYGFDEVAGNFQESNFDKGGRGGDAVQANAQDGAGYNNANFATPPDGQRPRMRMYLWSDFNPMRDGDFENGIVIHEYAHGISNRLTGGPNNVNCLGGGQAGGMGEGWGDTFANYFRQSASDTRALVLPMGDWVSPGGIRTYPYATDMTVNPLTYGWYNKPQYQAVHAAGTIWATVLYDAYWDMVDAHGFDADWYKGQGGNNKMLRNIVDGMKLQPCNPSMVDARDAILLADQVNYQSQNTCLLWKSFARRGLGKSAVSNGTRVTEAFDLPAECQ